MIDTSVATTRLVGALIVTATIALSTSFVGADEAKPPTVEEMIEALGFSDEQRQQLLSGRVIAEARQHTRGNELTGVVAMVVPASLEKVTEFVLAGRSLVTDDEAISSENVTAPANEEEWRDAQFAPEDRREIQNILNAHSGTILNLSTEEIAKLQDRLGGYDIERRDVSYVVSDHYREVLIDRFNSYTTNGLAGIAPYDRGAGRASSPADEINGVLKNLSSSPFLRSFPRFARAISDFPNNLAPEIVSNFYWIKARVEGRPVFTLNHHLVERGPNYLLSSSRDFFVGHTYNSLITIELWLPIEQGTVVFQSNGSASDELTGGLFAGMAREIGRKRMVASMIADFEQVRQRLTQ